jgi:hypothetical protein
MFQTATLLTTAVTYSKVFASYSGMPTIYSAQTETSFEKCQNSGNFIYNSSAILDG